MESIQVQDNKVYFTHSIHLKKLLLYLLIKVIYIVGIILYAGIGLSPDEAQYWTWSRALDWGYYSKPPGIAWQIWLGTQGFGHTELGIRVLSVLSSFIQSITVYTLSLRCGLQIRTAFWSGMLMAFCPFGIFGSLLAVTDVGLLLFWTLGCITMTSALAKHREANPIWVGLLIAGGALFKWPIYLFWPFFFIFRFWYFPQQSLRKGILGVLVSLLGLLPSMWWNLSHDWATFRHVLATMQGGHAPLTGQRGNVFEFIGSQALLISPVLFILLILAYRMGIKHYRRLSPPLIFCGFVSLSSFLVVTIIALFQKIQGNWVLFAYPTGLVLLAWYACQERPKMTIWLKGGLMLSIGLTILVLTLSSLAFLPYQINPFKHHIGWLSLKGALKQQGYDPNQHFLLSDKYQTTSILSFYSEGQKRAYFLNLTGTRKNQFSYWPSLQEDQQGKTGYFVWTENMPHLKREGEYKLSYYQLELQKYFEKVELLGFTPLFYHKEEVVKGAFIFRCHRCLKQQPKETFLY